MKILHITPKSIYPKVDGGCVAMDNFLRLLSKCTDEVHHLCISTPKHPFDEAVYKKEMPQNVQLLRHFFINTNIRPLPLLKSLFSTESYQVKRFFSEEMNVFLREIAPNYDAVIMESVFLSPYLSALEGKTKVYIRTHNVEAKIWERKAKSAQNPLKKWLFSKMSSQVGSIEKSVYHQVKGLIHISSDDEIFFKTILPNIAQITIPLSIQETDFISTKGIQSKELKLGFLGAENWSPNQEAVEKLEHDIFPLIQQKYQNAKLYIAGFGWEKHSFSNSNIINLGTIDNVGQFFEQINIFISPLMSGSGLKIKVVEAICNGKLVIGSPISFEGLEFLSHQKIAISTQSYLTILDELLSNLTSIPIIVNQQQEEILFNFGDEALILKLKNFVTTK